MDEETWRERAGARMAEHEERMAVLEAYIDTTDEKLVAIGRQNAVLSEMVEVLGGYVTAVVDHVNDKDR